MPLLSLHFSFLILSVLGTIIVKFSTWVCIWPFVNYLESYTGGLAGDEVSSNLFGDEHSDSAGVLRSLLGS